jgi:hypothetical protein
MGNVIISVHYLLLKTPFNEGENIGPFHKVGTVMFQLRTGQTFYCMSVYEYLNCRSFFRHYIPLQNEEICCL